VAGQARAGWRQVIRPGERAGTSPAFTPAWACLRAGRRRDGGGHPIATNLPAR
jgi:hypothetical protein